MVNLTMGILGIVASFVVGLIFYRLAKRRIRPYYCQWGRTIISLEDLDIPDLSLSYSGNPIEQLQATRLAVWNGGSEPINKDQVVGELTAVPGGDGVILNATIESQSREKNDLSVDWEHDPSRVVFDFAYLDSGDFAVVDLLHTGHESQVKLDGMIKGARKGVQRINPSKRDAWAMSIGGCLAGCFLLLSALQAGASPVGTRFALVGIVLGLLATTSWWASNRLSLLPAGLRELAGPPWPCQSESVGDSK